MSDTRDSNQPPASEPRAGDLLAGRVSRESLEQELDPQTLAQLAAWFGAPATGITESSESGESGESGGPARGQYKDPELRALWERRRRAMDAVDPALVARLDARTHAGDAFIRVPEPPTLTLERPLSKLDMRVWKVHLTELRDYERPPDIPDEMEERVPQALLRDLHRPVDSWPLFLQPLDTGVDVAGQAALARINEVIRTRYQVRMAERPIASRLAARHMAELRARLAEPWEDIEIPEERRVQASNMPGPEDMMWFGGVGYDPTL